MCVRVMTCCLTGTFGVVKSDEAYSSAQNLLEQSRISGHMLAHAWQLAQLRWKDAARKAWDRPDGECVGACHQRLRVSEILLLCEEDQAAPTCIWHRGHEAGEESQEANVPGVA